MLKKYIVSIIILVGFTCSEVISQTYATPELEKQAQENAASKKQVDSKSNTLAGVFLEVKNTTPLSETYLAKFFSISVYEITNFSPSNKSSFSEIQKEIDAEFDRMNIYISKDFKNLIFKSNIDPLKYRIREIKLVDNEIVFTDCDKCNKGVFTILQKDATNLVVEVKSQDDSNHYSTKLILN